MKREFVPLAQPLKSSLITGLYASIKLDGERAVWIPPTRGMAKEDVPFANKPTTWTARDTGREATGLWTRNGNIIHAPAYFLNQLPPFPVDMELYAGPGTFQLLRSTVSTFEPDPAAWELVYPCILDAVDMEQFLAPGIIATRQASILIESSAYSWWLDTSCKAVPARLNFKQRYTWLQAQGVVPVVQTPLPEGPLAASAMLDKLMDEILAEGGEGLILRQPFAPYTCARTRELLKHKPLQDAEATVIGYLWGKLPDHRKSLTGTAVGERLGVMGGMLVQLPNEKQFILSGTGFPFKDCQMVFRDTGKCAADVGLKNFGACVSDDIHNPKYPVGTVVTFTYRSFTTGGIPVEARFKRSRP